MDPEVTRTELENRACRLLLRYFHEGTASSATSFLLTPEDREAVQIHWALSRQVSDLCRTLVRNEATIGNAWTREPESGYFVRGEIDAIATIVQRRMSGDARKAVFFDTDRTFDTAANQAVLTVLRLARRNLIRLHSLHLPLALQGMAFESSLLLTYAMRLRAFKSIRLTAESSLAKAIRDLSDARIQRVAIYRLAYEAAKLLWDCEKCRPEALEAVFRSSVIAPLDDWKLFEMVCSIEIAGAIGAISSVSPKLSLIARGINHPICTVDNYEIYWQSGAANRIEREASLDEALERNALKGLGLSPPQDIPDIVIRHNERGIISVIEVKFPSSNSASRIGAVRRAVKQVVRYSRLYRQDDERADLISRSAIILPVLPEQIIGKWPRSGYDPWPTCLSLEDLWDGTAALWVERSLLRT